MNDINLFDLFREAVLDLIEADRGVRELSTSDRTAIQAAYVSISKAFFDPNPISYTDPVVRNAYTLSYAPKHAYVWRQYVRTKWTRPSDGLVTLNSYGTGPASEIVGISTVYREWGLRRIVACCYEREAAWHRLAQAVAKRFTAATGFGIDLNWVHGPEALYKGPHLVGSCVLSEVIREQPLGSFLRELALALPGNAATFLEPTGVTTPDAGPKRLLADAGDCRCVYLGGISPDWHTEIVDAKSACTDLICGSARMEEPKLHFLTYKFDS